MQFAMVNDYGQLNFNRFGVHGHTKFQPFVIPGKILSKYLKVRRLSQFAETEDYRGCGGVGGSSRQAYGSEKFQ
jgi:hypothetical protein